MNIKIILLESCLLLSNICFAQNNSKYDLKIEKLNGKYIYTRGDGDLCSIFMKSFEEANPFAGDCLAIVKDSLYYVINLYGERVSPYFREIKRHDNTGLYIGKENENSGYGIYDISFNKITKIPYKRIETDYGNVLKCTNANRVTYITGRGHIISDIILQSRWSNIWKTFASDISSWKELSKNNIPVSDLEYCIYKVERGNEAQYVDYEGNVLVPYTKYKTALKLLKKQKKNVIFSLYRKFLSEKDSMLTGMDNCLKENESKAYCLYPANFKDPLPVSISIQKAKKNRKGKIVQKGGKRFVANNGEIQIEVGDLYADITSLNDAYFLVKNYKNKYAIANKCGYLISGFDYDSFSKWSDDNGQTIYRVSTSGKYGLMKLPDRIVRKCEYVSLGNLTNGFAIAKWVSNNKYYNCVIDKKGNNISKYPYDNIVKDKKGYYTAHYAPWNIKVKLDRVTGKELYPTVQEQYFEKVNNSNLSDKELIEEYQLIINMGGDATAKAYNNLGYSYYQLGNRSKAKECFEKSKSLGCSDAADNLKTMNEIEAEEVAERRRQEESARQQREAERQRLETERQRQEAQRQQSEDSKTDSFTDLLNTYAELLGRGSSSSSGTYKQDSSGNSSSGSSNRVRANDKCNICLGSGKCMNGHAHSKSTCGGSGKCGTCNGKGYIVLSTRATNLCPNCDRNHNGKCKRCHGTGKCLYCNGTGIKR